MLSLHQLRLTSVEGGGTYNTVESQSIGELPLAGYGTRSAGGLVVQGEIHRRVHVPHVVIPGDIVVSIGAPDVVRCWCAEGERYDVGLSTAGGWVIVGVGDGWGGGRGGC